MEANSIRPDGGRRPHDATSGDAEHLEATIIDLRSKIASLEGEVERAAARGAEGASESPARRSEGVLAEAEHRADEIRIRALTSAERTRALAAEKGREIVVEARKDALEVVQQARVDADRIVAAVRFQESALWERVQSLQAAVRRTEQLLREVANSHYGEEGQPAVVRPLRVVGTSVEPTVAAEQARTERRVRSARGHSPDIPRSVEDLLIALKDWSEAEDG